jgi:hypothetical protein
MIKKKVGGREKKNTKENSNGENVWRRYHH